MSKMKQNIIKAKKIVRIMGNVLSKELETYEKNKITLLRDNLGKFVLIKGDKIITILDTYADTVKFGIEKFGNTPFLVRQVLDIEPTQNFTSNLIRISASCPL